MIKAFREYFSKQSNIRKVLITAYILLTLVFFYSYIYNDILETTRMGIQVWEDLSAGRIRFFYNHFVHMDPYAYTKDVQGVYDFPIYILFAIWDLPLYIIGRFTEINVFTSVGCMFWVKTMLLLFSWFFGEALFRLSLTAGLGQRTSLFVCLLFFTSGFFMTGVIMASAYDITAMLFTVLGVDYWIKGDLRKFTLMFMLAIPLKMFALLIYLPLLVLRQKNIIRILQHLLTAVFPILLFRFLIPCSGNGIGFRLSDMIKSTDLSNLALLYAITYFEELGLGETYYSVVFLGSLIAICYFVRIKEQEQYIRYGLYVCFLSYAILFVTCFSHPYWLLIMTPFVVILIGMNRQYEHVNLILETVMTLGMLLAQVFVFPWCFGNGLAYGMFWPELLGRKVFRQYNPVTLLEQLTGEESVRKLVTGGSGMGTSIFIACIIMFAVLNYPAVAKKDIPVIKKGEPAESWIMPVRLLTGIAFGCLPIIFYILT